VCKSASQAQASDTLLQTLIDGGGLAGQHRFIALKRQKEGQRKRRQIKRANSHLAQSMGLQKAS